MKRDKSKPNVNEAASALGKRSAEVRQKAWGKSEFKKRMKEWGKLGRRPKKSKNVRKEKP